MLSRSAGDRMIVAVGLVREGAGRETNAIVRRASTEARLSPKACRSSRCIEAGECLRTDRTLGVRADHEELTGGLR
jgi:hypothetical protein